MSQKRVSKEHGICLKGETHGNQLIQYICLENGCEQNRQLCRQCVSESHRKHKVGVIDKLIFPLNILNMNSHHDGAIDDYYYFQNLIKRIQQQWQKMNIIFLQAMQQLKLGVIIQLQSLMKTFTQQEIDSTYQIFINHSNIHHVNQQIQILKFLEYFHYQNVQKIKIIAQKITSKIVRSINKTSVAVSTSLMKMTKYNQKVDFKAYIESKHNKNEQKINKNEQQKTNEVILKQQQEQDSSLQINNKKSKSLKKDIHEDRLQNNKQILQYQNQRKIIAKYK